MHKNFSLFFYTKSNMGAFTNKRQDLEVKFFSRCQKINLIEFELEELKDETFTHHDAVKQGRDNRPS